MYAQDIDFVSALWSRRGDLGCDERDTGCVPIGIDEVRLRTRCRDYHGGRIFRPLVLLGREERKGAIMSGPMLLAGFLAGVPVGGMTFFLFTDGDLMGSLVAAISAASLASGFVGVLESGRRLERQLNEDGKTKYD